jgi:hypothetical protein
MYYFDDGTKLTSKVRALEYKQKTNLNPKLYYFDEVYDKISWKVEPPQSLDFYYREQAQRIRDNYDYVIICYSGGADSTNVLEAFHFNNIKIDKIVTIGALKQDSFSKVDENHNGELYHNVFPYVEELGLSSITQVLDYTELFDNSANFTISQYANEWIDFTGAWWSPHHWFWRDISRYIVPSSMSDKKIALVFGIDKPNLYKDEQNNIGFCFKDTSTATYGNLFKEGNVDRIYFYWDPSYPEILVKQLHTLKRVYNVKGCDTNGRLGEAFFNYDTIDYTAYNLRKPLLFKSPKSPTPVFSLRDMYLKDKQNSDIFDVYSSGIREMKRRIGADGVKNVKPILSKFYSIT